MHGNYKPYAVRFTDGLGQSIQRLGYNMEHASYIITTFAREHGADEDQSLNVVRAIRFLHSHGWEVGLASTPSSASSAVEDLDY